jgi:nucleoid DNA-binding protein
MALPECRTCAENRKTARGLFMATRPTPAKPKAKPAGKTGGAKPAAKAEKPAREPKAAKGPKDGAIRINGLIDIIAPNITVSRRDIRTAVDAALKAMGEALTEGKILNLPPLGKMSVKRTKTGDKSDMVMLKLRRPKAGARVPGQAKSRAEASNEALADDDE